MIALLIIKTVKKDSAYTTQTRPANMVVLHPFGRQMKKLYYYHIGLFNLHFQDISLNTFKNQLISDIKVETLIGLPS